MSLQLQTSGPLWLCCRFEVRGSIADYFVTVREFRAILEQLWRNGWTLVDPRRVAASDVRVPRGRKPLVLQEDDANYYAYLATLQ